MEIRTLDVHRVSGQAHDNSALACPRQQPPHVLYSPMQRCPRRMLTCFETEDRSVTTVRLPLTSSP